MTVMTDKVCDEEIMTNDDNLESNYRLSSLLKNTSGLHAGTKWIEWQQENAILYFNLIVQQED